MKGNIKSEFAKQHKIKLIRIPYWEFNNIDEILYHELRTLLQGSFLFMATLNRA